MEVLFEQEIQQFDYGPSHFSDAIYGDDDKKFQTEFEPQLEGFLDYSSDLLRHVVFDSKVPDASKAMPALFSCITRYKHRGFEEECEIRLVAAPTIQTQQYIDAHLETNTVLRPSKQIKVRTGTNTPVPYIEVLGLLDKKLPIERIIIGPSANKKMIADAVRKLTIETKIEVAISDIPYV